MGEWISKLLLRVKHCTSYPSTKLWKGLWNASLSSSTSLAGCADQFSSASASCSFHFPCYVSGSASLNSCQTAALSCYLLSLAHVAWFNLASFNFSSKDTIKEKHTPLVSALYSHITAIFTTLLTPDMWIFFPLTPSKCVQHQLGILHFNSLLTLSTPNLRSIHKSQVVLCFSV